MPKRIEVRISGLGGQGVVLTGQILGRAGVYDKKHVVQTQSYGAEARGSAAKSEVIISDSEIGFPKVRKCDILVAMSQSAIEKHLKDLKEKGTLIVDEDTLEHIPKTKAKLFRITATKVAKTELKSRIYTNVVLLGALVRITGIVTANSIEKAIGDVVPRESLEKNLKGFKRGLELVG